MALFNGAIEPPRVRAAMESFIAWMARCGGP
jgi:hypothetical protein